VQDDLDRVASLLRELLLEGGGGRLRLRAGLQVVLLELATESASQGESAYQHRQPGDDHKPAPPITEVS
jgi:hypothetical protein